MKNTGYVYANKALESAVKELKSSFFDIFYHSQGTLLMLMTQLDELEVDSEALKEEAVDLIIMGSSGKSGFDRFIMGSVADKVVNSAKCAVLVVH